MNFTQFCPLNGPKHNSENSLNICVQTYNPLPNSQTLQVVWIVIKKRTKPKPYVTFHTGDRDAQHFTWKFRQKWDVIEQHACVTAYACGCTPPHILSSIRVCFRCHLQKWNAGGTCWGGESPFSFRASVTAPRPTRSPSPARAVKMRAAGRTVICHSPIAKDNQAYTQIAFTFQVNLGPLVLYLPT